MEYSEFKFIISNQYSILLGLIEYERLAHPETYAAVARVGEKYREAIIQTGLFNVLDPIPQLDDKK